MTTTHDELGQLEREILANAERLGVSVLMVDTRPIPDKVRRSALNEQAHAFADWLVANGRDDAWVLQDGWLSVGSGRFYVEDMRAVLLANGSAGLLRLISHGTRRL